MSRYLRKQIVILVVFLLVISGLMAGVYFLFRPRVTVETCTDGIQNHGEEGIDCGVVCGNFCDKTRKPIEILYQNFIPTTENNYDLVAEIENPNNVWGAQMLNYTFYLYDANGENIASKQGIAYILPQEKKYIVEPKIYSAQIPQRAELKLGSISWHRLTNFRDVALKFKEKNIETGQGIANRLYGVIENNTSYNLDKIELVGIIFDINNEVIAAGKTEMTTLMIGEDRYFEIDWPYVVTSPVSTYDIKAYLNIFNKDTFINPQGGPLNY